MIHFQHVRKEYDDLVAVNDLDLQIEKSEVFGLIGPNGAGKTSTIRMACGLLEPTAGRILVRDIDVHKRPELAQQSIGYLADFFSVYEDLKVWEYLDYFAHAYKLPGSHIPDRVERVMAASGLTDKRDAMIKGLSRGMKQRLGIARAVIHRPPLLLLDEPASGLDPMARIELRDQLLSLREQGTTILISSHILTELEGFCTSIGLMEKGRMVRSGLVASITAAEVPDRVVRLRWIGDAATVEESLRGTPEVSDVAVSGQEGVFRFRGSEEALAGLLTRLTAGGAGIVSFGEVKQTIEDLYMKISSHEVM